MAGEQREVGKHQFVPEDYFREWSHAEIFPGNRPMELDVGCGDGGFLIDMAAAHPERDFLGLERLLGRVRKVCRKAERHGFGHVKVLRLESAYALEYGLPAGAFSRVHLLFPDPWPKKKHHARRIAQPATIPHFARVLAPGGEFILKTDHPEYFEVGTKAIRESSLFEELDWPDDAFYYAQTDFERQWMAEGKAIHRSRFVKVS